MDLLYKIFTSLIWTNTKKNVSPIEEDWIIIASDIDIYLQNKRQQTLDNDVKNIRSNSYKKILKYIIEEVKQVFSYIDEDTCNLICNVSLPSDIRQKIFKDTFTLISPEWLVKLSEIISDEDTNYYNVKSLLESNWYEDNYERNILGQLVMTSGHFCPNTLDIVGISQVFRNTHLSLTKSMSSLGLEVTPKKSEDILNLVICSSMHRFIDLWIQTAKQCKNALRNHGKLQLKWKKEEDLELEKIEQHKKDGNIKYYKTGTEDPIRRQYIENGQVKDKEMLLNRKTFEERRRGLNLKLLVRDTYTAKTIDIKGITHEDMNKSKRVLGNMLFSRGIGNKDPIVGIGKEK